MCPARSRDWGLRDKDQLMRLGFASFRDYVCERLGMGLRSAQEMARVSAELEELPVLRAASDRGQLKPSAVRLLVGFVTQANEAE